MSSTPFLTASPHLNIGTPAGAAPGPSSRRLAEVLSSLGPKMQALSRMSMVNRPPTSTGIGGRHALGLGMDSAVKKALEDIEAKIEKLEQAVAQIQEGQKREDIPDVAEKVNAFIEAQQLAFGNMLAKFEAELRIRDEALRVANQQNQELRTLQEEVKMLRAMNPPQALANPPTYEATAACRRPTEKRFEAILDFYGLS